VKWWCACGWSGRADALSAHPETQSRYCPSCGASGSLVYEERPPRPLPAVVRPQRNELALPAEITQRTREMIRDATAPSTRRAYRADWEAFDAWCRAHGRILLPATPETVAAFLVDEARANKRVATIERRMAGIAKAHELAGFMSPTKHPVVTLTMKGIRRSYGGPQDVALPFRLRHLQGALPTYDEGWAGLRARAILLVGYAGAFRRSELVNIDLEHIVWEPAGMKIRLGITAPTKTGGQTRGQELVAIPRGQNPLTCPVAAIRRWLEIGIYSGPVFRHFGSLAHYGRIDPEFVSRVVKDAAARLRLEKPEAYSAHSLRAGFATDAADRGVPLHQIMEHTRHKKVENLMKYIRAVRVLEESVAGKVGL
jgi:integrase